MTENLMVFHQSFVTKEPKNAVIVHVLCRTLLYIEDSNWWERIITSIMNFNSRRSSAEHRLKITRLADVL